MNVRCERCNENYEFDDARITEAGVTVKCTTCGYIFKVKKVPTVTIPVKAEDGQVSVSSASSIAAPPAGAGAFIPGEKLAKEWKVRQANGNVFTFKELTTLQKWIVERKVQRDDEISLTGEVWKRLGNIAELASFFQVVDEAQKAQQFAALQSAGALGYVPPGATPAGGYAIPSGDAMTPQQLGYPGPGLLRPAGPGTVPAMLQPGMQSAALSASGMPLPVHGTPQVNVTVHNPIASPAPAAAPPAPATAVSPSSSATAEDLAAAQIKKGGGGLRVLLVALALAAVGGGGYYGYFGYWLPQQEAREREAQARAEAERKAAEARAAEEKAKQEAEARAAEEARMAEEAARAAAEAAADAGTVTASATSSGPRNFDGWMALGDRLRGREKAEDALDAYGRAADLKPDRSEPHAGRGLALLDMGNPLQAEYAFLQALKLNPRYGVALMGLAETYRTQGKNEEAKKYYEQYLDVLPNGPEAAVARQALKRL